jgi:hypothetical protein
MSTNVRNAGISLMRFSVSEMMAHILNVQYAANRRQKNCSRHLHLQDQKLHQVIAVHHVVQVLFHEVDLRTGCSQETVAKDGDGEDLRYKENQKRI